jgi:hypothetical protein
VHRRRRSVPALAGRADTGQTEHAHQAGDALAADSHPAPEPQLEADARGAVGVAGRLVDVSDLVGQIRILEITLGGAAAAPLVVARPGDTEHPAGHRDVESVGGEFLDQPEPYFGSTFSRAK